MMHQPRFSLTYEGHKKYMCQGLSNLQQNGEFVDMTVAADGHYVKVHKMIMSLASPFFKDIICTAPGQHPMIYLNKVSSGTLSAILEYIYTGETHIAYENLNEFTQVAKDLHINGLDNIITQDLRNMPPRPVGNNSALQENDKITKIDTTHELTDEDPMDSTADYSIQDDSDCLISHAEKHPNSAPTVEDKTDQTKLLYTLSNKNSLMVIFNRYIYRLNYIYKRGGNRYQWKCINERKHKCPASLISENDKIIKRVFAHNHTFDDKAILKKMKQKSVFSTIRDVESEAKKPASNDIEDDSE